METTRRRIDTGWQVGPADEGEMDPVLHLPSIPAEVPGSVHLDLHRAGVISDPFFRLHERDVVWVDDVDWTYDTTFRLDAVPAGDLFLNFLGLDTIAEISLNDQPVGQTDCMFVPHEFDIGSLVRAGDNHLSVTFRSARRVGLERQAAWSAEHEVVPYDHEVWSARSFVRKAQYMFGWDWGPVLISCGIWRPVELVTVATARLLGWCYEVAFEGDRAVLRLAVDVQRASRAIDAPLTLTVDVEGAGEARGDIPLGSRESTVSLTLPIDEPRRWSPDSPALYSLELALQTDGTVVDVRRTRIGLRTIELVREPDADGLGEGFMFRVNGQSIFCKGANWIPADSFPSRTYENADRLRPLLAAAKDAGFTMLRVWGGGMYESDTFYELCDELGLLVWQDFPYACAYYPDDPETRAAMASEARAAVRRLRVHPSLALWCGNNENQQMYADDWHGLNPPRFLGEAIYDSVLPRIVAEEDPATPYWPGSAFGGPHPNSEDFGDRHNWDVWHGEGIEGGDWSHYAEDRSRFCSEFGFASSCGPAAWDTCLTEADRDPRSRAVQWHDKTRKGYDIYLGYIERHFPPVQSLDDLVYYSQVNQAEAMRFGVEHYRRLKGRCWGTLIWQLNDCWPVQSWSMIDYLGERKAVCYAARRFYAPVLLSLYREGDTLRAHIVNDLLEPTAGRVTVRITTFDGTVLREESRNVAVGANAAVTVMDIGLSVVSADPREIVVHASLAPHGSHPGAENVLFLAEPRDLRLSSSSVRTSIDDGERGPVISLEAQQVVAHVWLSAPGLEPLEWSDNFFHLLPGRRHTVSVGGARGLTAAALQRRLRVRTLNPS
jgi:beta-mannosidase